MTPTKSNWSECHGIGFEMVNEIYTILTEALEFYASRNVYERLTQFPGDNEAVECSDIAVEALARSRAALVTSAPKPSTVGRSNRITNPLPASPTCTFDFREPLNNKDKATKQFVRVYERLQYSKQALDKLKSAVLELKRVTVG